MMGVFFADSFLGFIVILFFFALSVKQVQINVLENSTLILCPWLQSVFLCKEAMFFLSTIKKLQALCFYDLACFF